jgi:hypothetical protein
MRPIRVCIYGGTDLKGMPEPFVSALAERVLGSMPSVIVTGGFVHSRKKPCAVSTDCAALEGARRYAETHSVNLKDYYEAWIPEPSLDGRRDAEGVVRMKEADGVAIRVMEGRTALGRRLAMVAGVDVVVTISGKVHTEVVIEQALEVGVPLIPVPDTGGDSKKLLSKYRERIAAAFEPGALDRCLAEVSASFHRNPVAAAEAVVRLIRTARIGRCLVLLPYDDEHSRLYADVIEPAIAKHMVPLRLDRLPKSASIYTSFADAILSSSAVIADITVLNENVMYEIGYAHGRGLTPLIYTRSAARLDDLPVYFRTLNVKSVSATTPVAALIDDYLKSIKRARNIHELSE